MRKYFKRKYFDYFCPCEKLSIVLVKYLTILYKLLFSLLRTISKGFSNYDIIVIVYTYVYLYLYVSFSKRFQTVFLRHTLIDLECYFLTRVSYPFLFCLFFFAYFSGNFVWRRVVGIQFLVRHSRDLVSALLFGPSCYFVSCSAPIYLWSCVSAFYLAFKHNLLFVIVLFYEIIVLSKKWYLYLFIFIKWFSIILN